MARQEIFLIPEDRSRRTLGRKENKHQVPGGAVGSKAQFQQTPTDRNCQSHPMWSKLNSAYVSHWWAQRSEKETGGERGAFEAALCSSGLVKCYAKPCYPEETVLSAEIYRAEDSFSIQNCLDESCVGPGERSANRFIGRGKAGDRIDLQGVYLYRLAGNRARKGGHPQEWKAQTRREMADEMAW